MLSDHVNDVVWPRFCPSASGGMHLIYRFRYRPWLFAYRYRDANGNWSGIEYPVNMPFEDTPWIIEDAQNRPHIFFAGGPEGNWPEHWTQIYEVYKQNGTWTVQQVTPSESRHHGYPRAVIDAQRRIHMVYCKTNLNSTTRSEVCYRVLNGTTWSADTSIGDVDNFYYQHPWIARDPTDNVHITWVDRGGTRNRVMYARVSGYTWAPAVAVGSSVGNSYITFPKVTVAGTNTVLVAANDDNNGSTPLVKGAFSSDGGNTWSSFATIVSGTYVALAGEAGGDIQMAYSWPGETTTAYSRWSLGSWLTPVQITAPTIWQLTPEIAVDRAGLLHVAYEDYVTAPPPHIISYINNGIVPPPVTTGTLAGIVRDQYGAAVSSAGVSTSTAMSGTTGAAGAFSITSPTGTVSVTATKAGYTSQTVPGVAITQGQTTSVDLVITGQPPAPVSDLLLVSSSERNQLIWTNPTSGQFSATRLVVRPDRAPSGPDDGTLVIDDPAAPGSTRLFAHTGLVNGTTYHYALYAYFQDASRFYAVGTHTIGTPAVKPDFDRDGDVDQADFGVFQACLTGAYVTQLDEACEGSKLDNDTDVDEDDAAIFVNCFSGPGMYAGPGCAG